MGRVPHRYVLLLGFLTFLGGLFGTIGSVLIGIRFLSYITASVGVGGALYVLHGISDTWNPPELNSTYVKTIDIAIFAGIMAMVGLGHTSPGVVASFYWVSLVVFSLIVFRAFFAPSKLFIVQIILFAIALRITLWTSAPVIRQDPRKHVGIAEYVFESGRLLSSKDYYYRDFPLSHVLTAATALLTGLKMRHAYFASISLPTTIIIVAVFAITRRLGSGRKNIRPALFAALLMAVSASHVYRTGYPIPQTLVLGLLSVSLLLAVHHQDIRLLGVVFFLVLPLSLTHNTGAISLAILFGLLYIGGLITSNLDVVVPEWSDRLPEISAPITISAAAGIAAIEFLYRVNYLQMQVRRLIAVYFFRSSESASGDITGATFGGDAYTPTDPVIHIGIGLFVTTIGLVYASHLALGEMNRGRFTENNTIWTIAAIGLLGIIGIGVISVGTGVITRIRPESLLVIVPVIAISLDKLGRRKAGAIAVCILLIATPSLAVIAVEGGHRNPLISPTNRAPGDFPNHLSSSEVSGLEFVERNSDSLTSDDYVTTTATERDIPTGSVKIHQSLPRNNFNSEDLMVCGTSVLYRASHKHYPGVEKPDSMNTIYDSGSSSVLWCE